ncbi:MULTISPECIES: pore-forming ESAT-6 family protein [Bacillus]|uniref:ESAT-6-like protein n=1 Tax=Bacillus salipaludis TaxID=2547811 RepID=A0A4R5VZN0_9BACI|nr:MULTISPECIES: pore-forming ESAT-6 family protein [Bacillus]MDQ6595100.1 pore-forming ESAT-6 family protein [Bacillus salipaludis]MED1468995.1 pore-forming ESAT-6 family protein [Bacillus salipaludis]TDK64037.1 WXG100 family type VII secretion target [Bacillus salipaludis]
MTIEGIKIGLNEVTSTASQIRTLNHNLTARLDEIKKEMNALANAWNSDASNTIRNNFNSLVPKFDNFREIVESYGKFLDQTVNSYDSTETAINNNASAFK